MRRRLYGNNIPPKCEYCLIGVLSEDETAILCRKKGIVPPSFHCRRFQYDPLKRVPKKAPALLEFTTEDFSL
ncbi:MAG: hypothetical protein BGN88_10865 [Clostridiales bacterium 43-6]|nr:MAG: hypothetical protein BGN88_10865 [Clostridiales bacterium 43-6]